MFVMNSSAGDRNPEGLVRVPEMAAEQIVELQVVLRGVVVAVPPEPVAPSAIRIASRAVARAASSAAGDAASNAARASASWLQARRSSACPIQM